VAPVQVLGYEPTALAAVAVVEQVVPVTIDALCPFTKPL
jgi:hypothetical protein